MRRPDMSLLLGCLSSLLTGGVFVPMLHAEDAVTNPIANFVDELITITPGTAPYPRTFTFGSDTKGIGALPPKTVTVRQPFAIGKYEVTQELYEQVMGTNPSRWKGPRNSVERMTHAEANTFCERITELLRQRNLIGEDEVIRLPSEIEWEYACRAGTDTAYSFGAEARAEGDAEATASLLDPYAWHTGNAAGNDPPIGALKPNPWGLYDMHGYLWEMTSDRWENTTAEGEAHVVRGGSWRERFPLLQSAARKRFPAKGAADDIGFRCVRARRTK